MDKNKLKAESLDLTILLLLSLASMTAGLVPGAVAWKILGFEDMLFFEQAPAVFDSRYVYIQFHEASYPVARKALLDHAELVNSVPFSKDQRIDTRWRNFEKLQSYSKLYMLASNNGYKEDADQFMDQALTYCRASWTNCSTERIQNIAIKCCSSNASSNTR